MKTVGTDLGILIIRITAGALMLLNHGWGKLMNFSESSSNFPDPIGLGSSLSMGLAIFAEVVCAALIVLGVMTRLASIPLIVTMFVAAFVFHWNDPWAKKEMALLFLGMYLSLLCLGGGRYSLFKGPTN
jgi:putative oxidoreductase